MKETLVILGQSIGKRRTKKEKNAFINYVSKPLIDKGIPVQLHKNSNQKVNSVNVLVGDFSKAKTIVVAGYDTGSLYLVKKPYYPLNSLKNKENEKHNLFIYLGIGVLSVIVILLLGLFVQSQSPFVKGFVVLLDFILVLVILFTFRMDSSPYNMNRNSAACALLYHLSLQNNQAVAFSYTDCSVSSYLGYQQLAQWLDESKTRTVILLEGLASGENLYVASEKGNAKARSLSELLHASYIECSSEQIQNSSLALFPHGILLFTGKKEKEDYSLSPSRSKADFHIDVNRLEEIFQILSKSL